MKHSPAALSYTDVTAAAGRIAGRVRGVTVTPADTDHDGISLHFALEFMQYTGSFKARGAQNFVTSHRENGTLPPSGVTIASGGNAGLACAWAAQQLGIRATVFLPENAPEVKIAWLRSYGADVRLIGTEYAEALAACRQFAADSGALTSHAYDDRLIAAGAGTLVDEILLRIPELDTIIVAVGGGGLFSGVAAAADHHGIRTIAVEPEGACALNTALSAGELVDVPVSSIAGDSLGARRASEFALSAVRLESTRSVLVPDTAIISSRQRLWGERRIAVEYGAAAAYAAVAGAPGGASNAGKPGTDVHSPVPAYTPEPGETVCVVLCGANTDPSTL